MTASVLLAVLGVLMIFVWRTSQSANEGANEQARLAARDESGVRGLIARDQAIAAIKLTRQITGLGLKESKQLVDAMVRGELVDFPVRTEVGPTRLLAAARDHQIRQLIARGDTIAAIKRWRELTGHSLAEAKTAVEQLKELPLVEEDREE